MHPLINDWLTHLKQMRRRHPAVAICVPWKRIYEMVRHYDMSSLMLECDKAGASIDYYGIERIEDGITYRLMGGKTPLKMLYPVPSAHFHNLFAYNIEPTIVSLQSLESLVKAAARTHTPLPVHLWINSGYRSVGIDSATEFIACVNLIKRHSTIIKCQAVGTKFPYEKGITTFSDLYKFTPKEVNALVRAPNSFHNRCMQTFNDIIAQEKHAAPFTHYATSFEVYANAVTSSTNFITVGNLFYYGFKPKVYSWPLELQQIADLPVGQCLVNDCAPHVLKRPIHAATLFSRIPTQHIYAGANKPPLEILDEDLNHGKVVVSLKQKQIPRTFTARRKFF